MSIEVLDTDSVARRSDPASLYLASVIREGPASYIDNANVRMEALLVDDKMLPLVISDGVAGNSNICSPYTHYLEYAFHELAKRYGRVPMGLLKAPRSLLGAFLRSGAIDRVVFVNNWLLTTNPRHGLSSERIAALTRHLTERYPSYAIVFRSINPLADRPGLEALRSNDYQLIPSRRIYMLDTANNHYLERSNLRRDRHKLRQTRYSIVDGPGNPAPQVARLTALYRDLYLGKHSTLNPQFNTNFFSLILNHRFMTCRAFIEDGRIDAFVSYFIEEGVVTASLIAYDLKLPQKLGLYRMVVALLIGEAAERKSLLNMSAGSGDFKMLRGGVPVQECDAVYDRHLPVHRRLPWAAIRIITRLGILLSSQSRE